MENAIDYELEMLKSRIAKLSQSQKNLKCPGVLRKLRRKLRYKLGEV